MYKLIHRFYYFNLDNILKRYKNIVHQEGVMIENSILFNCSNKISINDVVNYRNRHHKLKTFQFINDKTQKIN